MLKSKNGVAAFNRWREDHPDEEIDLTGAVLDNAKLQAVDFGGVDLRRATFKFTNLRGARLDEAHLDDANFEGADVCGATFSCAFMKRVFLRDVLHIASANFYGAVLERKSQFVLLAAIAESLEDSEERPEDE